ncbi:MAG: arsenosugar biosynthesis arsenite methyltransferase ArsM [bacterium]|nr:arsenosugar biosynthesis arsenite methyltransferase ArsM [bacterium]
MNSYLEATHNLYKEAALVPQAALCCASATPHALPGLVVPEEMTAMNYGCGTTVNVRDLKSDMNILYVGVGGGLEALQFAYFTRRPGSVVAVDSVPEMLERARENFEIAAKVNDWFDPSFVTLLEGNALDLPVPDRSIDLAAQNCLFNIFLAQDLRKALSEIRRTLRPGGALVLSDPISDQPIPEVLRQDDRLRAMCLSGALSLDDYISAITETGFGTMEIRGRRPYRLLDSRRYGLAEDILLESVELAAFNDPVPDDGPCVFTGRMVIYTGDEAYFDDGKGHIVIPDVPLAVCDKTGRNFENLERDDMHVTASTYHYAGGGCC